MMAPKTLSDQDYMNRCINSEIDQMNARLALNDIGHVPRGIENSAEAKRLNAYFEAENAKPRPKPVRWWTKLYRVFFAD